MIIESLLAKQSQLIKESRIVEAMKVEKLFKYAINRNQFSDFYMLSALSPFIEEGKVEDVGNVILHRDKLLEKIIGYYLKETRAALIGEADIFSARTWPHSKSAQQKLNAAGIEKGFTRSQVKNLTASQFEIQFKYMDWMSGYGGTAWAGIARLYGQLKEVWEKVSGTLHTNPHKYIRWSLEGKMSPIRNELVKIIDLLHNAEHNSGSLFTKFPEEESTWLREALTEKAIPSSIQAMKQHVSPTIWKAYEKSPIVQPDVTEDVIYKEKLDVELEKFVKTRIDKVKQIYNIDFRNIAAFLQDGGIDRAEYDRRLKEMQTGYQKELAKAEDINNDYSTRDLIQTILYLYPNKGAKVGLIGAMADRFAEEGNTNGLTQLANDTDFLHHILNPQLLDKITAKSPGFRELVFKALFNQLTQGYFPYVGKGLKELGAKYYHEGKKYIKDKHAYDKLYADLTAEGFEVSKPGEQMRFELPTPPISVKAPVKLEPTAEEVDLFLQGKTNFTLLMKAVKMFWQRMNDARADMNLAEAKNILEIAAQEKKNEDDNKTLNDESLKSSGASKLFDRFIKMSKFSNK